MNKNWKWVLPSTFIKEGFEYTRGSSVCLFVSTAGALVVIIDLGVSIPDVSFCSSSLFPLRILSFCVLLLILTPNIFLVQLSNYFPSFPSPLRGVEFYQVYLSFQITNLSLSGQKKMILWWHKFYFFFFSPIRLAL